jgi:hypothetical protein
MCFARSITGDEYAAQGHHAFHRGGHLGSARDLRDAHDFAYLEDVDAECLLALRGHVRPEREEQDLQLVRAGKLGAGVDASQEFRHVASFMFVPWGVDGRFGCNWAGALTVISGVGGRRLLPRLTARPGKTLGFDMILPCNLKAIHDPAAQ